jgi:hypothetical protein
MKVYQAVRRLTELGCTAWNAALPTKPTCNWCPKIGSVGISSLDTSSGQLLLLCTDCAEMFIKQKETTRALVEQQA